MTKPFCLGGFKHVGKSFWGQKLAQLLDVKFVDLDELIHQRFSQSAQEIYKSVKEEKFRAIECETLESLDLTQNQIIALGGGTLVFKDSLDFVLKQTHLVIIDCSLDLIEERIFGNSSRWGLLDPLDPKNSIRRIYNERQLIHKSLNVPTFDVGILKDQQLLEAYAREYFR